KFRQNHRPLEGRQVIEVSGEAFSGGPARTNGGFCRGSGDKGVREQSRLRDRAGYPGASGLFRRLFLGSRGWFNPSWFNPSWFSPGRISPGWFSPGWFSPSRISPLPGGRGNGGLFSGRPVPRPQDTEQDNENNRKVHEYIVKNLVHPHASLSS
ncbi:MAG: hypothetical protein LBB77_03845, partial [Treponema sp.]|nr:hypothetical protein [Treponema sp.]